MASTIMTTTITEDERRKNAQIDFPLQRNNTKHTGTTTTPPTNNIVMHHPSMMQQQQQQHRTIINGGNSTRNGIPNHHQQQHQRHVYHTQQQLQQHTATPMMTRTSPSLNSNSSSRVSMAGNNNNNINNTTTPHAKQPKHHQHSLGGGTSIHSASSNTNSIMAHNNNTTHPTPLFQRLVSEEVQELKAYARIIETQNRRLSDLERVHCDLELRLELQSNRRMELERTLEDRERKWAEQIRLLEEDRESWKKLVDLEGRKNAKLMDQVARKDQDIHRMLQRKYDQKRDGGGNAQIPIRTGSRGSLNHSKSPKDRTATIRNSSSHSADLGLDIERKHESPHQLLNANGSCEDVRERNVTNILSDFFGIS